MKKAEYYINVSNGKYPKVSGYVEEITDDKGNTLMIGYDKRHESDWKATELTTGFCVSQGVFDTRNKCVENVHNNINAIINMYNIKTIDKKCYDGLIKPFEDFVNANRGVK